MNQGATNSERRFIFVDWISKIFISSFFELSESLGQGSIVMKRQLKSVILIVTLVGTKR